MKILRCTLFFLLILAVLAAAFFLAGYLHARRIRPEYPEKAELSPRSGIRPGDEVTAQFPLTLPADRKIVSVTVIPGGNTLSPLPVRQECIRRRWDHSCWRMTAVVRAMRPGECGAGSFECETASRFGGGAGETITVAIPGFTVAFPDEEDPGAPLVTAGAPPSPGENSSAHRSRHWLWLLMLPPLLAIWFFIRRRKREKALPFWKKTQADILSLQRRLQAGETGPAEGFSRLCDIVREYLELRYRLPVSRETTQEFLVSTAGNALPLSPEQRLFLSDFLHDADIVKFAAFPADRGEILQTAEKALLLVRHTIPAPEKDQNRKKSEVLS